MKLSLTIKLKFALCFCFSVLLFGCTEKGMDAKPDFASEEKYQAKINSVFNKFTQPQQEAFNWAVSNLSIPQLKQKYEGKSYRQIAESEIAQEIGSKKAELAALEKRKTEFEPILAELNKITVDDINTVWRDEFMTKGVVIKTTVTNGSKFNLASVTWDAALYLDGAAKPEATGVFTAFYKISDGLTAGQTKTYDIPVDSFMSNQDWGTLAVQKAKSRIVKLQLHDATDFRDKSFASASPFPAIKEANDYLTMAETYLAALIK